LPASIAFIQKIAVGDFWEDLIHFFGDIRKPIAYSNAQPWPNFPDLNGAAAFICVNLRPSAVGLGFLPYSRQFVSIRGSCPFAVKVGSIPGK
jgi:hypothetical protein